MMKFSSEEAARDKGVRERLAMNEEECLLHAQS